MKKGDVFETEFEVSEKVYRCFLDGFNDRNPMHTNDEYAKKKGFKSRIIHGNILGGFISFFVGECLEYKNVVICYQDIKYLKPIYLNDNLILNTIVFDVFESINLIEFRYKFIKLSSREKIASGKIQIIIKP